MKPWHPINISAWVLLSGLSGIHSAVAMELDRLLPSGIPGFTTQTALSLAPNRHGETLGGVIISGVTISPEFNAATGYDSAPNATQPASALFSIAPSLQLADKPLGFGAFAGLQTTAFPQHPNQGSSGYSLAFGQALALPNNTVTLAAALLRSQQTGFALEPLAAATPATITASILRASDDITAGMTTLTPQASYISAASSLSPGQHASQTQTGLKLQFAPDGVLHLLAYLHATRLAYTQNTANAWDYTALLGLSDTAAALWDFRLAAGITTRAPRIGKTTSIPIIEAATDWAPGDLTIITLSLAHEIDDPERVDTSSYTITEAKFGISHEYLRDVTLTASTAFIHAAFFASPLVETITQSQAGIAWRLNQALQLSALYAFNDRQANLLRAANEHVATISLSWSL